jgi:hypothetical protein
MEKTYINDLSIEAMSRQIVQFCALSGIEPPIASVEFFNLIKEAFGRYPSETMTSALKDWMVGKIDIRSVKQMNIRFISEILRTYIENHRHEIQLKPKKYLEIAAPEQPKLSSLKMAKDMFTNIQSGKGIVYPSIFAMAYEEVQMEVNNFEDELTYIMNIEDAQLKKMVQLMGKKKVKRDTLPREVYIKAAKMLNLLKNGKC